MKPGDLVRLDVAIWETLGMSSVAMPKGSIGIVTSCETAVEFHVSVLFGDRRVVVHKDYLWVLNETG